MSLNFREIDLILSELQLTGSKAQNFIQIDFSSLYIEFFDGNKSNWLYVGLQAGLTRLHLSSPPRKIKGVQPRFSEFLKARLKSASLLNFSQYRQERIVILQLENAEASMALYIRLWGNAANILAVNPDGTIADAFYRRPAKNEISGKPLQLPPLSPKPVDFSRFAIREWPKQGSFNDFIAKYYGETSQVIQFKDFKERLERQIQNLISRYENRSLSLAKQIEQFSYPDRFKQLGEMILSAAHAIKKGQIWLEIDDWYNPGQFLRIELDPTLDAPGNAERYFQKFRKARDGMNHLRQDYEHVTNALQAIYQLTQFVAVSENLDQLRELSHKIDPFQDANPKQKSVSDSQRPGLAYTSHGFLLLIGRSAAENDVLLRKYVRGNDFWLHVRDFPGGYVFIKIPRDKSVPLEVLVDAAHLAAWYSKAKGEPEIDLFYTQVKYLRRAKHGTYGTVIPTRERNLHVRIDAQRVTAMKNLLNAPQS